MKIIHDMGEGAHKLGRVFLAAVTTVVVGWVIVELPDVPLEKLMMIVSVPSLYIGIKGKGHVAGQPIDKNPVTDQDFTD